MDKVYRLLGRPIAMGSQGCRFVYGDTGQPVPIHTYASLAEEVVGRWLASPEAPRLAAVAGLPADRRWGRG